MKTDTQLHLDVLAELKWEPSVHTSHIGVAARDGVVTLSGHVSSYLERCSAESVVRRVGGVLALVMDIDVKLPAHEKRSDTDIACMALQALEWMKPAQRDSMQVLVEDGWITVTGHVRWQHQKQAVTDAMRHIAGITGISNQISIVPVATLMEDDSMVEASLRRCALHDAQRVTVKVDGCVVTLSGVVENWWERQTVVRAAWSLPGVRNVVDQLVQAH